MVEKIKPTPAGVFSKLPVLEMLQEGISFTNRYLGRLGRESARAISSERGWCKKKKKKTGKVGNYEVFIWLVYGNATDTP